MARKLRMQPYACKNTFPNGELAWEHKPEWRREDLDKIIDSDYKDLGWENGWLEIPKMVKECYALKHTVATAKHPSWRGVTEYKCATCKYKYMVDSGD